MSDKPAYKILEEDRVAITVNVPVTYTVTEVCELGDASIAVYAAEEGQSQYALRMTVHVAVYGAETCSLPIAAMISAPYASAEGRKQLQDCATYVVELALHELRSKLCGMCGRREPNMASTSGLCSPCINERAQKETAN